MASPYTGNTTQVESDISASHPNDPQLSQALNDAIAKFSSGAGGTSTVTVQNVVPGEVTTATVANVDTTKGGDVSGVSGSAVLNFQGSGSVSGDITGGDHVVVLGGGPTSLSFTNAGTNYISTGAGKADLAVLNTGESTVVAGTGPVNLTIGNYKTTVDLSDSAAATVASGYGNSTTTLGTGTYSIDAGGGYDFVNAGAKSSYTTSLDANGDIVLTDAAGHVSSLKGVEVVTFSDGSTVVHATSQAEATIAHMYEAVFDRTPDADGIAHWWNEFNEGRETLRSIAEAFLAAPEAANHGFTAGQSPTAFVDALFENALGRAPDAAGESAYVSALNTGTSRADVLLSIAGSAEATTFNAASTLTSTVSGSTDTTPHTFSVVPDGSQTVMGGAGFDVVNFSGSKGDFQSTFDGEHTTLFNASPSSTTLLEDAEYVRFSDGGLIINANTEDQAVIARLYDGILDRNADSTGLQFWWGQHDAGTSLSSIANSLISSPEFTAAHASISNTDFVGLLYENLLGRTGSAPELAAYTAKIDAGLTRADIAVQIAQAGEAQIHNADTIHLVYTP